MAFCPYVFSINKTSVTTMDKTGKKIGREPCWGTSKNSARPQLLSQSLVQSFAVAWVTHTCDVLQRTGLRHVWWPSSHAATSLHHFCIDFDDLSPLFIHFWANPSARCTQTKTPHPYWWLLHILAFRKIWETSKQKKINPKYSRSQNFGYHTTKLALFLGCGLLHLLVLTLFQDNFKTRRIHLSITSQPWTTPLSLLPHFPSIFFWIWNYSSLLTPTGNFKR